MLSSDENTAPDDLDDRSVPAGEAQAPCETMASSHRGSLKALSHLLGGLEVGVGVGGVLAEVETVDLFIVAGTQADQ